MSGHGGTKHRNRALGHKRSRLRQKARADIVRVRGIFEHKGQAWDPQNNPAQLAALNHDARRMVSRSTYEQF